MTLCITLVCSFFKGGGGCWWEHCHPILLIHKRDHYDSFLEELSNEFSVEKHNIYKNIQNIQLR